MSKTENGPVMAWHFVGATLRDGRPIPADGVPLKHEGPIVICNSGLHASERLIDALQYAPGHTICRVEVRGRIKRQDDKLAGAERMILWRVDGETLLREFACWCALEVAHLWDMPAVVREYLETQREDLRDAARDAARAAAWDAAWDAASAWDAARAAAWDAASARDAAWDAAWDAQNTKLTAIVEAAHAKESAR